MGPKKIRPTVEWMREKFDWLNNELFGGVLPTVDLKLQVRGNRIHRLGEFGFDAKNIKVERSTRRLYINLAYKKLYISSRNFSELQPYIALNGSYLGTEDVLLNTLCHEMCHLYNYMNGICPKQAHGTEFRYIASIVATRSRGYFKIQRLATADEMKSYEMDEPLKQKVDAMMDRKKAKMIPIFVFMKNGQVRLVNATTDSLVNAVIEISKYKANKILTSKDPNLINRLFELGFKSVMRKYRFWDITNNPLVQELSNYKMNVEYRDGAFNESIMKYIMEAIDEVIGEGDVDITPNMNLSDMSPLEV